MTAIDVHGFEVLVDDAPLRGEWADHGEAVVLLQTGVCNRRVLDVAGTVESGEQRAGEISGVRPIRLRPSAHLPSLEEPDRFLRRSTAFLPPPDDDVVSPRTSKRAHAALSGG